MIVIILKQKKSGIYVDAKVIKTTIEENTDHKCSIRTWDQLNNLTEEKQYSHKFAIEHLTPDIIKFSPKAKLIYIPNLEFLTDWDVKLGIQANIIMAKTIKTNTCLRELYKNKSKIVYSKFTSLCTESKAQKDFNIAVHFAGSSFLKGTDLLVKYWMNNNGFLRINSKLILVITFNPLKKKYINFWKKLKPMKRNSIHGRSVKCEKVLNIYMVKQLNDADYAYFREKAGFYICPSIVEGFGHYINEGRCNSSVTITTNASPMNELIRDTHRLIKVYKTIPSFRYMSWLQYLHKGQANVSFIDCKDFSQKMNNIFRVTPAKLKQIALKDHKEFLRDRDYFTKVLLGVL